MQNGRLRSSNIIIFPRYARPVSNWLYTARVKLKPPSLSLSRPKKIRCKQFSASLKVPRQFPAIRLIGYFIRVAPLIHYFLSLAIFWVGGLFCSVPLPFASLFIFAFFPVFSSVIVGHDERILTVCPHLNWPPLSAS